MIEALSKAKKDTVRGRILIDLSLLTQNQNYVESYNYARQAIDIFEKTDDVLNKVRAYNAMGSAFWYHTDYNKAQDYYFKAFRLSDSIKNEKEIANSLYNIGWMICVQQQNFKAIDYLYKSMSMYTKQHDTSGILQLYNAFGNFFSDYYNTVRQRPLLDSALRYYNRAVNLAQSSSRYNDRCHVYYGNIGDVLAFTGDYKAALFYCEKSLKDFANEGDSIYYYLTLANMGKFHHFLGEDDKAIAILQRSLRYSKQHDAPEILEPAYSHLYMSYKQKGDLSNALVYLEKYMLLKDTLNARLNSTNIKDKQNSYEIEKREVDIKQLKQVNEIHELKEERNVFYMISAGSVILIILVIAWLLFKQNKEKNIINQRLSDQNSIITNKKHEIDNSINYAKGIQNAVLPDIKDLKAHFANSFVFYQPKDVVSGDFYWFTEVNSERVPSSESQSPNSELIIAAADCTGHGVPGALMSIVSMDKISQAVFEKKITDPSSILGFLNVEIKKALKQHNEESKQKDGLDIALLKFNKANNTLQFAGANRPLYIVRNKEVIEYRADKVAIAGFTPDTMKFAQSSVQLQKNDCVYVFSDGYADQFGGPDGKKFMSRNFKEMLESISDKPIEEQEKQVVVRHQQWKGNYEQVDDILVIGIKI